MEFVIYGAGYRGKRLQKYLGNERVVAYIDSNEDKLLDLFNGKPVISLNAYIKNYGDTFVIISPGYSENCEIESMLVSKGIYNFCNLAELPSEFQGYGTRGFLDSFDFNTFSSEKSYYIYGFNAFSLMIYETMRHKALNVRIVMGYEMDPEQKKKISDIYGDIPFGVEKSCSKGNEVVILAARETENILQRLFGSAERIDAYDYSADLPEYRNKQTECMKHAYRERERCFIVATGPSLREEDLGTLWQNRDFCIGMNRIYMHKGSWMPDVYVCVDSQLIRDSQEEIDKYGSHIKFIGDSCQDFWMKEHKNTYRIHTIAQDSYRLLPNFSIDISQKVYGGATVTYPCIQIAIYLGFKKIYLVGVDCNYVKNSVNNYFFKSNVEDNRNHHEDRMISSYIAAKKYADEHGIKIYNATRGGALEVFERVDFDSLFKGGK